MSVVLVIRMGFCMIVLGFLVGGGYGDVLV